MDWLLLAVISIVGLIVGIWRKSWWLTVLAAHLVLLALDCLLFETTGPLLALIIFILFWISLAMLALFLLPLRKGRSEWWLAALAIWGFAWGRTRSYYGTKGNELVERKKGLLMETDAGPGIIILAPGNYAIALSEGTNYTRVDGPGLVFTHRKERPLQLVDLRPQIRPAEVEATTQDGIQVKTKVFVASRVKGSGKPGGPGGEYPYNISEPDVFQAIRSAESYPDRSAPVDEVILNKAVALARDELATFRLDRLWGLDAQRKDPQARLQERIRPKLKEFADQRGIEILGAGLNPIGAPEKIIDRRIRSGQAAWQEQITRTHGEGEAEVLREMGKARAQAQRDLIMGILAGLDNPRVSDEVIAYQFITALENAIQNPSVKPLVSPETERTLESLRRQVEPAR